MLEMPVTKSAQQNNMQVLQIMTSKFPIIFEKKVLCQLMEQFSQFSTDKHPGIAFQTGKWIDT